MAREEIDTGYSEIPSDDTFNVSPIAFEAPADWYKPRLAIRNVALGKMEEPRVDVQAPALYTGRTYQGA